MTTTHDKPSPAALAAAVQAWATVLTQTTTSLPADQRSQLAAERTPGWQQDAACATADPEAWFPDKASVAPAQVFATCDVCAVRRSCLASALLYREHGVWAGTTAFERRSFYRLLRAGVPAVKVLDAALASQSLFSALLEDVA
jgi:hypothetical protein